MKKLLSFSTIFTLLVSSLSFPVKLFAVAPGSVVINEVAWAGSQDSSGDEWIELYNNSPNSIDLTGWKIIDDDTSEYLLSGTINAFEYFLIEDPEEATSALSDQVIAISLANTGDSLKLVDQNNVEIDIVNSIGTSWFAGSSATYGTMERISANVSGDLAENWQTSEFVSANTGRSGSPILGTPGSANSNTLLESQVVLEISNNTPSPNETVTLTVSVQDVQELYSYGFLINYDPNVLSYSNSTPSTLLNANNSIDTSFQSALENNAEGRLLVAESRLQDQARTGVSGSGILFQSTFTVIGQAGNSTSITISPESFLANQSTDLVASFHDTNLSIELSIVNPVQNLQIAESVTRYALDLNWNEPLEGADEYKVFRKNHRGDLIELFTTNTTSYTDNQNLIPNLDYEYQVVAVKQGQESDPVSIFGHDSRGLKGDNDRSDRVDGRDLQRLSQKFAFNYENPDFDFLVDTNFDGLIDGSDLIDLSQNFGLTY